MLYHGESSVMRVDNGTCLPINGGLDMIGVQQHLIMLLIITGSYRSYIILVDSNLIKADAVTVANV